MKLIKTLHAFLCSVIIAVAQPIAGSLPAVKTTSTLTSLKSWCSNNQTLVGLGSLALVGGGVYFGYRYWKQEQDLKEHIKQQAFNQKKADLTTEINAVYNDPRKICTILHEAEELSKDLQPSRLIDELISSLSQEQKDDLLCDTFVDSAEIAKCLFRHGAQVNKKIMCIESPSRLHRGSPSLLHKYADHSSRLSVLRVIIAQPNVDFSVECPFSGTPLELAASRGNVEAVKLLLEKGGYPEEVVRKALKKSQSNYFLEYINSPDLQKKVRKQLQEVFESHLNGIGSK